MNGQRRLEIAATIASAVIVAAGVLFFGWSTFAVLAIYWIENVVIGAFNLLRIIVAAARARQPGNGVLLGAFFTLHYGLFCLAHAYVIVAIFGGGVDARHLFDPVAALIERVTAEPVGVAALLAIVVAAGIDAARWLASADELERADPQRALFAPYGSVVVLHVVLLVGGFLLQILRAPAVAALLLVGAKLASDWMRLRAAPASAARTTA
jgi:hypothetical protein